VFLGAILISLVSAAALVGLSAEWYILRKNPLSFGFQTSLPAGTQIWTIIDRNGLRNSNRGIVIWESEGVFTIAIESLEKKTGQEYSSWRSRELSAELGRRIWDSLPKVGDPNIVTLSETSMEMTAPDALMGWCFGLKTMTTDRDIRTFEDITKLDCVSYQDSEPLIKSFQKLEKDLGVSLDQFTTHLTE
jgi:hypothetical protein